MTLTEQMAEVGPIDLPRIVQLAEGARTPRELRALADVFQRLTSVSRTMERRLRRRLDEAELRACLEQGEDDP